jgi:ribonuclease BN (tRNA processing enzyme)
MTRAYDLANEDDMSGEFDFHEYDGPVDLGPFRVEPIRVAHPVPAYGIRVTAAGHSLAYTGDTGPCDALDRLAEGVDLLLAEASFRHDASNPPDVHLTGRQAGELAARHGVSQLVITHVPPWYDVDEMVTEARLTHDGKVSAAVPGATYSIS